MTYYKIFWSDLQYPKNKSEKPLSWKSSIFSISSGMWSSHFRAGQKILCCVISHLASSVAWQFIDEKFQDNLILFPQRFYVSGSNASLLAPAGHLTDHNTLPQRPNSLLSQHTISRFVSYQMRNLPQCVKNKTPRNMQLFSMVMTNFQALLCSSKQLLYQRFFSQ